MAKKIITHKVSDAIGITHLGTFHADDILATAMILELYPNGKIARVAEITKDMRLKKDAIIYDVGKVYDPENRRFDHHQGSFKKERPNGIKYSSAGLIWKEYGEKIIAKLFPDLDEKTVTTVTNQVDRCFIEGVDGADNGQKVADVTNYNQLTFSGIVSTINTTWRDPVTDNIEDDAFTEAVEFASYTLFSVARRKVSDILAKDTVNEKIAESTNHIMILGQFVHWQGHLFSSTNPKAADIWYIVFYDNKRKSWNTQCVPDKPGSYGFRMGFPKSWWGNEKATGVKGCHFVHNEGFIAASSTKEAAVELAYKAVEAALDNQ